MTRSQERTASGREELFQLRQQLARINDRLSALKAEGEALLRQREPIQARIAVLEDRS